MARLYTKVKIYGSWANIVVCDEERIEAVKAACEALAAESLVSMAFKVVDGLGNARQYACIPALGAPHDGWHTPRISI